MQAMLLCTLYKEFQVYSVQSIMKFHIWMFSIQVYIIHFNIKKKKSLSTYDLSMRVLPFFFQGSTLHGSRIRQLIFLYGLQTATCLYPGQALYTCPKFSPLTQANATFALSPLQERTMLNWAKETLWSGAIKGFFYSCQRIQVRQTLEKIKIYPQFGGS